MSNTNNPSFPDFAKLVPGFDFLQNLTKQAAGSPAPALPQLPGLGSWIAPTLNVEELEKRLQELKAVQFWLDQNAAALKATIQALEVQKMTLATLKGMNFNMAEMASAFQLKVSDSLAGANGQRPADKAEKAEKGDKGDKARSFPGLEIPPSTFQAHKRQADAASEAAPEAGAKPAAPQPEADAAPAAAPSVVDPMQWWGALTQQFQTIAADAMKEAAKTSHLDATQTLATGLAKDAVKSASDMAKGMAETATKTLAGSWTQPGTGKAAPGATPRKAAAKTKAATGKTAAADKAAPKTAAKAAVKTAAKAKPATAPRKASSAGARKTTR